MSWLRPATNSSSLAVSEAVGHILASSLWSVLFEHSFSQDAPAEEHPYASAALSC